MSRSRRIALVCPGCRTQLEADLWESVNVTVDPSLRARLFRRELNVVHCATCDARLVLPAPLLYHDIRLRFAVQYVPAKALTDARQLGQFAPDGTIAFPPAVAQLAVIPYLLAPQVVFSIDEMIRYIEFREALAQWHGG